MPSLAQRDSNQQSEPQRAVAGRAGIIHRIGDDLRGGHNVELSLTVTLSLCIALLSVFSFVGIKGVGAATLAVLALLAASGLATRHQSEEVSIHLDQPAADVSGEVPADRFLKMRMPALDADIAAAADIRLVGGTLTRTVRDLLPILDRRLRKGASICVLIIDGDSPPDLRKLVMIKATTCGNAIGT